MKRTHLSPVLKIPLALLAAVSLFLMLTTFSYDSAGGRPDVSPDDGVGLPSPAQTQQPTSAATPEVTQHPALTPSPSPPAESPTPMPGPPKLSDLPVVSINEEDVQLAAQLDSIAKKNNCVGVSLAVFEPVKGYSTYQYGMAELAEGRPVEENTKFRVASLSKVAATIIAMRLVDDRLLDIDEDISAYLGYEIRNPNYPDDPVTCRMLIQHTASLYDSGAFNSGAISYDENTARKLLGSGGVFRNRKPGELHEYSDFGYAVLGAVCESVSGKLFDELARDVLFVPLGIDAAYVPANLNNKNVASQYSSNHTRRQSAQELLKPKAGGTQQSSVIGNLTISALDYAKILNVLTHGGTYDEVRIISEKSTREMHDADVLGEYDYMQGLSVRMVEGDFFGEDIYYHTGSAYGTLAQFFYSLENKRIVVVVTTGAGSARGAYYSIEVCNELSGAVW